MNVMRRIAAAVTALILVAAFTACSPQKPEVVPSAELPSGFKPAVTVHVIDNRYEPAEVEIEAGEAVRWVFEGRMDHDVVAEDGSFVSELITAGEYIHVFDEPGEWRYDCSVHPEMVGTITVS